MLAILAHKFSQLRYFRAIRHSKVTIIFLGNPGKVRLATSSFQSHKFAGVTLVTLPRVSPLSTILADYLSLFDSIGNEISAHSGTSAEF
jgi:hypothetical protein